MSYCRFSSDDFQSDLYVYANVSGDWTIHVAGNRVEWLVDLPEPVDLTPGNGMAWAARHRKVLEWLDEEHEGTKYQRVPIDLPHDGETFSEKDPGSAAVRVTQLMALGYRCPDHVVPTLLKEQQVIDDAKARGWHPTDECRCDGAEGIHKTTCEFWPLYTQEPT